MKDFRTLQVWEKSHKLTLRIYLITKDFPKEELYGLIAQIRRSAASIPVNIAEGCGRGSNADFSRFLQMSMGSASETEYWMILSNELGYINEDIYKSLISEIQEIKRMLVSLINKAKSAPN